VTRTWRDIDKSVGISKIKDFMKIVNEGNRIGKRMNKRGKTAQA